MNRSLSLRSKGAKKEGAAPQKSRFMFNTFRASGNQAELSRRLFRLIKTENNVVSAYTTAGRERSHIAQQLSEWGAETNDDTVDDISDKLGVLLAEMGGIEEQFAQDLEDYRLILKQIRNTEKSVQPSRDHKQKLTDQIAQLKYKEPTSIKLMQLEQELVRAEAENLVAEAQLTNVTRQKLKEAYAQHFAAYIERAERQMIIAKYGRQMLAIIDDTPIVPGEKREEYEGGPYARDILSQVEDELANYRLNLEEVETTKLEPNLMPSNIEQGSITQSQEEYGRQPVEASDSGLGHGGTTGTTTEPSTEVKTGTVSQPVSSTLAS